VYILEIFIISDLAPYFCLYLINDINSDEWVEDLVVGGGG
jgi:hypothetical protein